jgi:hypothetical protein
MLRKYSVITMVLFVAASLIGMSSIYQPANVETQPQQASGTMIGKVTHTIVYASSDGKACLANAQISTKLYRPNYPLGLKPGDTVTLLASDGTFCDVLNQAAIAKIDIQFWVALAPLTVKAIPPTLREIFASNESLYRVIFVLSRPGP